MDRDLPSRQDLVKEIEDSASHAFQRSGRSILAFSKVLGRLIVKNKTVQAAFRKAKREGYEAKLGLEIHVALVPSAELELSGETSRKRSFRRPLNVTYTTEDRKIFEGMKIVPPDEDDPKKPSPDK